MDAGALVDSILAKQLEDDANSWDEEGALAEQPGPSAIAPPVAPPVAPPAELREPPGEAQVSARERPRGLFPSNVARSI